MSARARQLRRAFFGGLVLFVLSILSLSTYSLWQLRSNAITNGLQLAALHARSFENFLTQSLRVTEQTAANRDLAELATHNRQLIQESFVTTLRHTPFLRSMSLQDANGRILISSNPDNVGRQVATQDYLPLAAPTQQVLRLGQPWQGRDFATGAATTPQRPVPPEAQSFVPMTRTLDSGGRGLTLLLAVNPDYFLAHMANALVAEEGSVEVLRYDGILLLGTAPQTQAGSINQPFVQNLPLNTTESGTFEEQQTDSDQATLSAFRASTLYPFVVITRLHRDDVLQQWQTETKTLLAVLAPTLLAFLLFAAVFYQRQMEAAAQRSKTEQQLRINATVFDAASEAIVITDAHGHIMSVNRAFQRMTGYTEQEVLGRSPRLLDSTQQDDAFYADLKVRLSQIGMWQGEQLYLRKDGSPFDAHVSLSVSRDSQAQAQHYVGVIADITERKQAWLARDEAMSRLRKIANRVPGLLYEYRLRPDGAMSFPYASDAISNLYGGRLSPEDVRADASKVFELIHPDDASGVLSSILQSAKNLTPWQLEYRVTFDGMVRWLHGTAMPEREADGSVLWHGFLSDITERKRAEAIFRALFDQSSFLAGILDHNGCLLDVNITALQVIQAAREDVLGRYFPDTPWWHDAHERRQLIDLLEQAYQGIAGSFEATHLAHDGRVMQILFSAMPIRMESGYRVGVFGMDITDRKRAEEQLKLAASVFSNSREGILITDTAGAIVEVNEAFTRITGYSRAEVLGQNPRLLNSGRQKKAHYVAMWKELTRKGHWYGEIWNRRKNGEVYAEMLNISTVRDAQGQPQHYVALFSDITVTKEHEQQLDHLAHYDTLTNLPNRVLLADRLSQSMAQAQRRGLTLAVVFLDLDGFKSVNDTHGHEAGDQLLMALASRMKQALREGDTLARIGGDEFVAVLVDLTDTAESVPILQRLQTAAAEPFLLNETCLQVSASLGVTFYPQEDEIDADQLQRQADLAMYQAKVSGKNRYHFFDAAHDRSVRQHHESLERIRQALRSNEFVMYYQPKVNMRSGKVIGVEALIRWQHPERGLLLPASFLPVIENHPLAVELGDWVLHQALKQLQTWQQAGLNLPVSVNVSARQLQQRNFVAQLQGLLALYPDMPSGHLQLEVLETSALEDIGGVSTVIDQCRKFGVLFALDDFGTGYSSLTYLKRLPVALLKIDQSFVRDTLDDPANLAILQGVIGLAKALQRQVIAEGVETVAQGCTLLQLGCDLAQGYGIAHPMPAEDMAGWLSAWQPDPAWQDTAQDQHPSA